MGVSIPLEIQKNWHHFEENNLTDDCNYKSVTDDSYDEDSGVVTPGSTTDQIITVILDEFNQTTNVSGIRSKDDVEILAIDKISKFPVLNLNVKPKVDDQLLIDSITWIVKGISTDPAKAMWNLHIRPLK
jgi:hypothetical protein